jgi:hypothetical protein
LKNKINQEKKKKGKIQYKNKIIINKIKTNTISEDILTFYRGHDEIQCKERQKKEMKRKQIYWRPISSDTH